ncbi:TPA: TraC family protein [Escherichia coli]|nr:TraC family protein [Escherichia coli]
MKKFLSVLENLTNAFRMPDGASEMTRNLASLDFPQLTSVLPYRDYDRDSGLFVNRSTVGFLLRAEPLTGAEERTFTVLEPLRVPDNALRAAETFAEYIGAVAMMNERYWTVAEVDTQDAVVTLRNADGESVLLSPQQNTAQDISLFTPRDLTISQGDRVRFTRSDTDRGYVANSLWEVAGFTDEGAIRFRQGDQEKIVDPQAMTEDRHIDLAYALTVYGVQGASERFAIALTGTEGGRKRMASLESTYVTLSRAKEHVQVYTDNLEDWQQQVRQIDGGKTAHDLLHEKSDRESDTGNRLLATASRLDKTALGRRVLAENGLEGETMARFIAAGKKYPSPYVALPVWTRHGKEAGALLTEIRIEDDGMRVVLSEESRLRGGEDAQFAGLQASRNGQTLIADSADAALRLAQENPESGVVIRLHGEERLLNAARLTGGRITEPDELSRALRNVADAETAAKAEDPITLPPDEQQKLAEVQEKAARELAEQARRELLSVAPQKDEDKRDPLLSADDERCLRDGTEQESRELDEAVREAVAGGRGARQQVREQMQRTEREWVVKMPEKEIELEKTLGGDRIRERNVCLLHSLLLSFFWAGLCSCSVRPVVQRIHFCSHCGQGVYGLVQQSCCCAAGHHLSVPAG